MVLYTITCFISDRTTFCYSIITMFNLPITKLRSYHNYIGIV